MKIEVLYFSDCLNYLPARNRLQAILLQQGIPSEIVDIEIRDESAARSLNFAGSPTIRINGLDIEPNRRTGTQTGLACRLYAGGLPSEEMIRSALREAQDAAAPSSHQNALPRHSAALVPEKETQEY